MQAGIVDRVACDFTVDTLVAELLLEQSSAAGSVGGAVLDPTPREIGVVRISATGAAGAIARSTATCWKPPRRRRSRTSFSERGRSPRKTSAASVAQDS